MGLLQKISAGESLASIFEMLDAVSLSVEIVKRLLDARERGNREPTVIADTRTSDGGRLINTGTYL